MPLVQKLRATGIVAALGAVGGALGGVVVAVCLSLIVLVQRQLGVTVVGTEIFNTTAIASLAGAVYGAVLGPVLCWSLMRRVPLGRAIGETAFMAALGVGAAAAMPLWGASFFIYPIVGATLAAIRLRYSHRAPRALPAGSSGAS